jgi:pyridinium-3,5-biscarboxylic acid mononucleotide synthase
MSRAGARLPGMRPGEILDALVAGTLSKEEALERLQGFGVEDLGFARLDHDRPRRRGLPEVIYGQGKIPEQVREIFLALVEKQPNVLATRVAPEAAELVMAAVPDVEYDALARTLALVRDSEPRSEGTVLVVCAGTSDLPVAREAAITSRVFGNPTETLVDVGVAGLHRLLSEVGTLRRARVLIVVAGMEAALPTVIAGLVDAPVIAVPSSAGYGASFGGVTALLGMLNSCAGGVAVVNIDNGFGAAMTATLIARGGR